MTDITNANIAPPPAINTGAPPPPPPPPNNDTELQRLSGEAAARRHELRDAQGEIQVLTQKLTTVEQTRTQERNELTGRIETEAQRARGLQNRVIDAEVRAAAASAGIVDLDVASLVKRDKITFDPATGAIAGIADAITEFKTAKPHFFRDVTAPPPPPPPAVRATGNADAPPPPPPGDNTTQSRNVRALSKEDYAKAKNEERRKLMGLR